MLSSNTANHTSSTQTLPHILLSQGTNAHVLLKPPTDTPPASSHLTPWAAQDHNKQQPLLWERSYLSVVPPAHSVLKSVSAAPAVIPAAVAEKSGWVAFEAHLTHPSVGWLRDHVVG